MHSYRAYYAPLDRDGFPVPCDTGVLPYVQVKADNAEKAQRLAHALKGCPITNVERLEPQLEQPPVPSPAMRRALDGAHAQWKRERFAS